GGGKDLRADPPRAVGDYPRRRSVFGTCSRKSPADASPPGGEKMSALGQLIVAATFTISAPYGLPDSDFCATPPGSTWGTVESVREVPLVRDIHAFDPEALEHKVAPETAEEVIVRLDTGPVVIFPGTQPQGVHAGQRVVVTLTDTDAQVQSEFCSIPAASSPLAIAESH